MKDKCNCYPLVSESVAEYLPQLLAQYDSTIDSLSEEDLEYLDSLLTSGELSQAREMLSDFAYEIHAGELAGGE